MAGTQRAGDSSSSSANKFSYEVFLSFNAERVGNDFVDYVSIALSKKGFKVYNENDGKEHDKETRKKRYQAIEQSRLSVVIVTKQYVRSPWCLDELVKILEQLKKNSAGHNVLPVFYHHMEPIEVGKQLGRPCEEAFAVHEEAFAGEPGKVEKWRSALAQVAKLAVKGLSVSETSWYEARLRQNIIEEVWKIVGARRVQVSLDIYGSEATAESIRKWMEDVVKIWNESQMRRSYEY
uniref:ADP-ribosyl cyclase/cyclic ADP-ribose hydrolase n=1 Tax=Kalanchoe fedtschenkoi TaxID=63787 RepID=A0A7N0RG31_KALFE